MRRLTVMALAFLLLVPGPLRAQQLPVPNMPYDLLQSLDPGDLAGQVDGNKKKKKNKQLPYGQHTPDGNPGGLIPESVAVGQAMSMLPGSKALGVRLVPGERPVYAVKLRTRGQVQRVLVDAMTGAVLGQ